MRGGSRRLEAERALGFESLRAAEGKIVSLGSELAAARAEAERAGAAEARLGAEIAGLRAEHLALAEQVSWLSTTARDAAEAARPLLAARDDNAVDVDEAVRDERARWTEGADELRTAVGGLLGCLSSLSSELHLILGLATVT